MNRKKILKYLTDYKFDFNKKCKCCNKNLKEFSKRAKGLRKILK